ncbi:MAG: tetratricopeptide repeat protein, partial [Planctomycetes bacterium]|nr:tetratricopeptide repeat protein [Planctomycetota bacterium]
MIYLLKSRKKPGNQKTKSNPSDLKETIRQLEEQLSQPLIHNLPYPTIGDLLKGRGDELDMLQKQLAKGEKTAITQAQAIHGLGGIGKTRLAVEFGWHQIKKSHASGVFFVLADSLTNLISNLANLAKPTLLNLPKQNLKDQPALVDMVIRTLSRMKNCLVIFDNVDDGHAIDKLHEILPQLAGCQVLITSRRSNWKGVKELPIYKLAIDDAIAYLLEKTKDRSETTADKKLAGKLADKLDGLPIALEQAAAYINYRHIGFQAYLGKFEEARKEVLQWHKDSLQDYPKPVLVAWKTTENQLGLREKSVLRLASFLAPDSIPTKLFEEKPESINNATELYAKENGENLEQDNTEQTDIRDVLAELSRWSMINLTEKSFYVHRLVQDSVRLRIPDATIESWTKVTLAMVRGFVPSDPPPDDIRSWDVWNTISPHVLVITDHGNKIKIPEPTAWLMNSLALYFNAKTSFEVAETLYHKALAINENTVGPDHPNTASCLNNLAQLYQATNRLKEAEPLMQRALKIDEASLGKDHPKVATDLNNLAALYQATNRLKEAEP